MATLGPEFVARQRVLAPVSFTSFLWDHIIVGVFYFVFATHPALSFHTPRSPFLNGYRCSITAHSVHNDAHSTLILVTKYAYLSNDRGSHVLVPRRSPAGLVRDNQTFHESVEASVEGRRGERVNHPKDDVQRVGGVRDFDDFQLRYTRLSQIV